MKWSMRKAIACLSAMALTLSLCPLPAQAASISAQAKYLYSGASHTKYTNEAYYCAPIVTDLNNDGKDEVISVSSAITVTDAATGQTKWRVNSGKDRTSSYEPETYGNVGGAWCDAIVDDIDNDGWKEIISVHKNCISVLDYTGYFKPGWPKYISMDGSIRSVAIGDFYGDGTDEIIVGCGVASETSVWAYDCRGNQLPGWPQLSGSQIDIAESYGVFGNGISTGDIDGDNLPEIIVPTDNRCIQAYEIDGSLVMANASEFGDAHPWGYVRTYLDYGHERMVAQRGWDTDQNKTSLTERLCMEFGHAGSVIDDLDGDGDMEIVVTGIVMDTQDVANMFWLKSQYMTVCVFNGDRTRYVNPEKGFDWTSFPSGLGGRLKDATNSVASFVMSEPVTADLDGDGNKEILFNSYDGKLYCFTLDQQMKSFTLPATTASVAEYAAKPVCKDINGDGKQEIIFGSWTDSRAEGPHDVTSENTGVNGSLYVLDSNLKLITRTQLPTTYPGYYGSNAQTNGVKSAPVVADIDKDGQYEVVLNTSYRSVCTYDLIGSTTRDTPFVDLDGHWGKQYVMTCVKKGYLSGTSATTFEPNGEMTRGMMTSVLYRIAGSPSISGNNPFTDVDISQWYASGALWSWEKGLLKDLESTSFKPDENITREELAYMLYQYDGAPSDLTASLSGFSDSDQVSDWALDAMKYCVQKGILQGSDGALNPQSTATRAEVATMLTKFTA